MDAPHDENLMPRDRPVRHRSLRARATSELPIHRDLWGKLAMFFSVKVTS
jgi:hypothetical protein